jgi:7-cyano-7-deazaguanine synthase
MAGRAQGRQRQPEAAAVNGTSELALVLFSGGQDSTTCLAWALDRFATVETIAFAYGQRHSVELEAEAAVRAMIAERFADWRGRLGAHHKIELAVLKDISDSALLGGRPITVGEDGLPTTFVPGRNILFLTIAAAVAYRRQIRHLIGGMCETDFSGYPDCRDDTIKALQVTLNLAMEARFVIHTPLMRLDKAGTWRLARTLGGDTLIELIREHTHTCYLGNRSRRHPWGYGCGECPACRLREQGHLRYLLDEGAIG